VHLHPVAVTKVWRPGGLAASPRSTPELAEGLELDLVVLIEPESFGDGVEGAVDRYVAMMRAPQRLVVLGGS